MQHWPERSKLYEFRQIHQHLAVVESNDAMMLLSNYFDLGRKFRATTVPVFRIEDRFSSVRLLQPPQFSQLISFSYQKLVIMVCLKRRNPKVAMSTNVWTSGRHQFGTLSKTHQSHSRHNPPPHLNSVKRDDPTNHRGRTKDFSSSSGTSQHKVYATRQSSLRSSNKLSRSMLQIESQKSHFRSNGKIV